MTIWKFQLQVEDVQYINMPKGATFLSVGTQYEIPCVWAMVDPDAERVMVPVHTMTTGSQDEVEGLRFLGTYQLLSGQFVGHVFVPDHF